MGIAALIVVVFGFIQWYFLPNRSYGNIVSTFGSISRHDIISTKNSFAVYVAMGWLVLVALFLSKMQRKFWGLFALGMFGILVLWSLSRSAVLGMILGLLWLLINIEIPVFKRKVPKRLFWLAGIVSLILFLAFLLSAIQGFQEHTPIGRIASLFANPEESHGAAGIALRGSLFKQGLIALRDHPFFGYGFFARSIEKPGLTIVDNFYLDVALDTGIIGLLLMTWFILEMIVFSWHIRVISYYKDSKQLSTWAWGIGGALICLFTASISASIPYLGRILGSVMIAMACLVQWKKIILYKEA